MSALLSFSDDSPVHEQPLAAVTPTHCSRRRPTHISIRGVRLPMDELVDR